MMTNGIHQYVVSQTWQNINKIVKDRKLTVLYREPFTDDEIQEAKRSLLLSWYMVDIEVLGNDDEKVLLINLEQ